MQEETDQTAAPRRTKALAAAAWGLFFLLFLYFTHYFHRYDWDTVETILLPALRGESFPLVPYAFLLYGLSALIADIAGPRLLFYLLLAASCIAYAASGLLVYATARHAGCSALAAFAAAGSCLAASAMIYGGSHIDDNIFQVVFLLLAVWLLLRPGRLRFYLSAIAFGISAGFHVQSIPIAPALLVLMCAWPAQAATDVARRIVVWGLVSGLVFLLLLVAHADPRLLFDILGNALTEGRDAFAIVKPEAPPWLATLWGMVAGLLPFPVNTLPLFQHQTLGPLLLIGGVTLVAGVVLSGIAVTLQARSRDRRHFLYLLHLLLGLAGCAAFAYLFEPESQERWIQGAPFFALLLGELLRSFENGRFGSLQQRLRPAIAALIVTLVIAATLVGRPLAHLAFADSRKAISAGLVQELAAGFDESTALLLDDGFEMVAFYRTADSCYRIVEFHALQIKCWGPEGRRYLPVDKTDFLEARAGFAIYGSFPELAALNLPNTGTAEVCNEGWLSRLFGPAACVTLLSGSR